MDILPHEDCFRYGELSQYYIRSSRQRPICQHNNLKYTNLLQCVIIFYITLNRQISHCSSNSNSPFFPIESSLSMARYRDTISICNFVFTQHTLGIRGQNIQPSSPVCSRKKRNIFSLGVLKFIKRPIPITKRLD